MKQLKFTLYIVLVAVFNTMTAQDISKHALGLRIGDSDGLGAEISYQHSLAENHRLEFDLGWRNSKNIDAFKLVGLYQWVNNISNNFNWFVGAGAGVGSYSYAGDSGSFALVAGDIGIEYDFDFPLLISLDARPELGLGNSYSDDLDLDIALGIRYQF